MKRLLSILFASVVMLSVGQPAFGVGGVQPPGYTEGIKVDKDGMVRALDTEVKITFPNGVAVNAANIGAGKEFYISYRTDTPACVQNVCGGGTKLDPFDGSTLVKFESAWGYAEAEGARALTVMPSTLPYMTNGTLKLISNCVISGWGATIKAETTMAVSGVKKHIFGSDNVLNPAIVGNVVQGFKLDNNINNQATTTNICVGAICFYGSYNKFLYNKCVGWGQTSTTGLENFVVAVGNSYTNIPAVGNEIAYNEITQEVTPMANGSAASTLISCSLNPGLGFSETSPTAKWNYNAWIHDNFIHDIPSESGPMNLIGVGAWSVGQKIENNTFLNIPFNINGGIYADTGHSVDALIKGNNFWNCNVGIKLAGAAYSSRGMVIEGNHFALTVVNPSYGITVGGSSGGLSEDITIRNNTVKRWNASGTNAVGVFLINSKNALIAGNKVENNDNHCRVQTHNGLIVRDNTFDEVQDYGGGTGAFKTANNHKNDGTRLALATDTDAYQGMGTFTAALLQGSHQGNMSLGSGYQARNIDASPRVVLNTSVTLNTSDFFVVFKGAKTTDRTCTLPSAAEVQGFLYLWDKTGDSVDNNITLIPDLEDGPYVFDSNIPHFVRLYSDGTNWILVSDETP